MTTDLSTLAEKLIVTPEAEATPGTEAAPEPEATEEPQDTGEVSEDAAEAEAGEPVEDEAGDDVEGDAEEPEADDQPQLFTVKVDGQEKQVTIDELTRGYSGQEYIQRGMQEAATRKQEAEQLVQQVEQMREQFLQQVQAFQQQGQLQEPQAPDPALIQSDPYSYMQQQAQYQADLAAYQQQRQQIEDQQRQHAQAQEQAMRRHLEAEQAKLVEMIPELGNEATRDEYSAKLVRGAVQHYGVPEAEVKAVADARYVSILADALKYREMQAAKPVEVPKPTRTVKPKAKTKKSRSQVRQEMKSAARKSQSVQDFANLLLDPELRK